MKKENLEIGNKLQERIRYLESNIDQLENDNKTSHIEISIPDHGRLRVQKREKTYTDKANTNMEYLNQFYRDNILRTLEDCKNELEKEFELLGK